MSLDFTTWRVGGARRELPGIRHTIFTRVDGTTGGAPVTLVHGFPTSSHDWADVTPALIAAGHEVRTLDLLGFGDSDKPADYRYSLVEQADIVEAMWAADGVDTTALIAHDYGVTVAQELLARDPDRITAMGWLNGGLYPDLHRPTRGQKLLHGRTGPLVARAFNEARFATSIREVFGRPLSDASAHEMWLALANRDGHLRTPALLRYIDERTANAERWIGALEGYSGPQHFIWGPADPVSGGHVVPRLRERLPHATITVLDDPPPVGHYPQVEAPELVAPLLVAAIAG
jgi:pimeloyl-ACP methyl ester carboxylesterase